jgi:fucose permease
LNVTPGDILLYNNQIYVTDAFMAQYSQALLITAVTCLFIGFGLARLMDDIIIPYLRPKIQTKENDYEAL